MNKKDRLKSLLPSLRERNRYVKIKVISEEKISYSDLESAIFNTLLNFYGELNLANMSVWILKNTYDENEQTLIIRCNNKSVDKLIAGLGLISRLGDIRIILKVLGISGTIKGLG
jgi:ribonuclease P/MRP protein subunit POP5